MTPTEQITTHLQKILESYSKEDPGARREVFLAATEGIELLENQCVDHVKVLMALTPRQRRAILLDMFMIVRASIEYRMSVSRSHHPFNENH